MFKSLGKTEWKIGSAASKSCDETSDDGCYLDTGRDEDKGKKEQKDSEGRGGEETLHPCSFFFFLPVTRFDRGKPFTRS